MKLEKIPSTVFDIMNKLVSVDGSCSVKESAEIMLCNNIGSIIVTEKEKPIGIVTKSDLLSRVIVEGKDSSKTEIRDIMSTPLITIEKDENILEAIRFMRKKNVSRLIVTDNEKILGIISETDLIRAIQLSSLTSFSTLLHK